MLEYISFIIYTYKMSGTILWIEIIMFFIFKGMAVYTFTQPFIFININPSPNPQKD